MIRKGLDVVPIVQPKHRLEEDARLAAERRSHCGVGSTCSAAKQVERYRITSCDDILAVLKKNDGGDENKSNNSDTKKGDDDVKKRVGKRGLHLFSLLPSPELGTCTVKTLRVLKAPQKKWKGTFRTVYRALLRSPTTTPGATDADKDDDDDDDDDDNACDFVSLPLQEYKKMTCVLLALPSATGAVAQARVFDAPLHALCYGRTESAKEGQGISLSWHSGMDTCSAGFKRNYTDNYYDDDEDVRNDFFDYPALGVQQLTKKNKEDGMEKRMNKKDRLENDDDSGGSNTARDEKDGAMGTVGSQRGGAGGATSDGATVCLFPMSTLGTAKNVAKSADSLDLSKLNMDSLDSIVALLLEQWVSDGKVVAPFSEVARVALKSHPNYSVMKEKHQALETRQEAVNWFHESQVEVRTHILRLGYTIDSSGNVYLSRQNGGG